MGMVWYGASILIWCVISGIIGSSGPYKTFDLHDFSFMFAVTAFFYSPAWFAYISWLAVGEHLLFSFYPKKHVLFVAFIALSFASYSALVLKIGAPLFYFPKVFIWPAAVVAFVYCLRRSARLITDMDHLTQGG
jgi:hypothetical protein